MLFSSSPGGHVQRELIISTETQKEPSRKLNDLARWQEDQLSALEQILGLNPEATLSPVRPVYDKALLGINFSGLALVSVRSIQAYKVFVRSMCAVL